MSRTKNPVPFAAWEPDKAKISGAVREAKGVISSAGRYVPLLDLTAYHANARMPDTCIGAGSFYSASNAIKIMLASASSIYHLVNRVPVDISKSGGYTASRDWVWDFEQFGDYVVAVGRGVAPQVYQLGVSSLFGDLPGSPPQADCVFRVKNQLVLGSGRTLSWSAFNDITTWTPDTALQSGTTDLDQNGGRIVAGVGGELGMVFQERSISRMTYVLSLIHI